jgi:hypothetical protein
MIPESKFSYGIDRHAAPQEDSEEGTVGGSGPQRQRSYLKLRYSKGANIFSLLYGICFGGGEHLYFIVSYDTV